MKKIEYGNYGLKHSDNGFDVFNQRNEFGDLFNFSGEDCGKFFSNLLSANEILCGHR
ncbi:hypothetical protein ALT721_2400036 [Alteromonas alvinellae]